MLNRVACVEELIKAGAELVCEGNWQPLHEAAKAGHNDIIEILLDAGCDVKNPSKCKRQDWCNFTSTWNSYKFKLIFIITNEF